VSLATDSAGSGASPRSAEHARLAESRSANAPWRTWGPYLSGRQWGTVREDYSEFGDGSGTSMTLADAAAEIDRRLIALFRRGPAGRRPSEGARIEASDSPPWNSQVTFSEYFHGDTGEGLGASHQTGWTALVAHVLCRA
jgi:hypothetical protein